MNHHRWLPQPDCSTQGTTDNRTITATDLITDRRAGGTTNSAANGRIHGRIAGIRLTTTSATIKARYLMFIGIV